MPAFAQATNPNSFVLRYKRFKYFRSDIWGSLAFHNKKNAFYKVMRRHAQMQLQSRIRFMQRKKKRFIRRAFRTRYTRKSFEYDVTTRPKTSLKKPLKFRSSLQVLRKKLLIFYGFRLRRKPMRKIFAKVNISVGRRKIMVLQNNRFVKPIPKRNIANDLESRIDIMLYRANFIQTPYEGRRFIREKKAFVLEPAKHKDRFFRYYYLKECYHKVPLFHFVTLRYDLALRRKMTLIHLLWAGQLESAD